MGERSVVLDIETTGLDPNPKKEGHRVTELGCVELLDRRITGVTFQSYLNPERELDERAAEITGLTREFLSDKPLFKSIAEAFLAFIQGAELIIHNAPFDLGFLNHELSFIQYPHLPLEQHFPVIDTLPLAKKLYPGHRYYNLDALCQRHGIDNTHRERHGALLDAEILAEVYLKMTAGQVSLGFEGEEDPLGIMSQSKKGKAAEKAIGQDRSVFGQQQPLLKVIYATSEELALHQARVNHLCRENN